VVREQRISGACGDRLVCDQCMKRATQDGCVQVFQVRAVLRRCAVMLRGVQGQCGDEGRPSTRLAGLNER